MSQQQKVHFVRTETDLFNEEGYDVSLQSSSKVEYYPITNVQDRSAPITFLIQGNDSQYIDFAHSLLYMRLKLTDSAGKDIAVDADAIAPVNYTLHSIFKQASLTLNDTSITPPNSYYPYKAYLETLLAFGKEYKKTQALAALYTREKTADTTDEGFKSRAALCKKSAVFEVFGRLHVDLFNQFRYLIPGVDIKLTLDRAPENFSILQAGGTKQTDGAQVQILEAKFVCQKHTLLPSITLSHLKLLEQGHPVCYPMRRGEVKTATIPTGSFLFSNESLVNGLLPDRVVIGLVNSSSVHGNRAENPFDFGTHDVSSCSLIVNSEVITAHRYDIDFNNKKCMEAYFSIFSGLGISNCDTGLDLTFDEFKNGKTLYVFDIRNQNVGFSVPRHGNLKLDIRFEKANTAPLTVIMYCDYQSTLFIDKNRHVYFKELTAS